MTKWAIELGEHDIAYKPRSSIKGQALADFLVEIPDQESVASAEMVDPTDGPKKPFEPDVTTWSLYTDGAAGAEGCGAGVILVSPEGEKVTYALRFDFRCSNNEAEYEALLAGLKIALELKVEKLEAFSDSMLVVNQINGSYEAKEVHMGKYLSKAQGFVARFKQFVITQIPRTKNKEADALSKLAAMLFRHLTREVLVEVLPCRSIEEARLENMEVGEEAVCWTCPIKQYLENGSLPNNEADARKIRINAGRYTVINGMLYRKGYSTPWLRCLSQNDVSRAIEEVHEGLCGAHTGSRALTQKLL